VLQASGLLLAADGVANQEIARRCRDLIELYDREVTILERLIHQRLRADKGYEAIQALNGVGRTMAAIFCAEIGDVTLVYYGLRDGEIRCLRESVEVLA
jgi:transposase